MKKFPIVKQQIQIITPTLPILEAQWVAKIKNVLYNGKVTTNSLMFRKKEQLLQRPMKPKPDRKALHEWTHHGWLVAHNIAHNNNNNSFFYTMQSQT